MMMMTLKVMQSWMRCEHDCKILDLEGWRVHWYVVEIMSNTKKNLKCYDLSMSLNCNWLLPTQFQSYHTESKSKIT
jgi:hypothetical protein